MKKILFFIGFFTCLSLFEINEAKAQLVVVKIPKPPSIIVSKPTEAKAGHVWVEGHWFYNDKTRKYEWKKGHWKKENDGHDWEPGKWVACEGGHKWVPGKWKARGKAKGHHKNHHHHHDNGKHKGHSKGKGKGK